MAKGLGDSVYGLAMTIPWPSDGNGSVGDAVETDGSDRVSPTDASTDNVFGVIAELPAWADSMSDVSAGDRVGVVVGGDVIVNAGGSVTLEDVLIPTSTAGRLGQNSDATGTQVDVDGTTDQGVFAPSNPMALSDSGATVEGHSLGTNEALVILR